MKSALLTAINTPLEISDTVIFSPKFGQVSINVICSGICGAQLQEIRGEKGTHFPRLMGHEGCGTVIDIGAGVKTVKVGDKVVMHWRKGDGCESDPPRYKYNGTEITGGQVTTFSQYSTCSENRVTAVPKDTSPELACLLGCSLSTALGTIESEAKLKMGETILIIGCGGLGLNLIRAAKMAQASYIAGSDIHIEKGDAVLSIGAHAFYQGIIQPRCKFDVIVDTTGSPDALRYAIPLLESGGRLVMVGQPKPDATVELVNARHLFDGEGKTIMATQGGRFNPAKDILRYVALWKAGLLNLDGIISHRIPLENINEGIELVKNGLAGRVMVTM